jgi:hypothetical protein
MRLFVPMCRLSGVRLAVLAAAPVVAYCGSASAQLYYAPSSGTWGAASWSTVSGGPYNTTWTAGSEAIFSDPSSESLTIDQNYTASTIVTGVSSATFTLAGNGLTTLSTGAIVASNTSTTLDINNVSLGGSSLLISGVHAVNFGGTASTNTPFNGTVTIENSAQDTNLALAQNTVIGAPTALALDGSNSIYMSWGTNVTIGSLSGTNAGVEAWGSGGATLTVNQTANTTFSGSFHSDGAIVGSVALEGTGTLALTANGSLENPYNSVQIDGGNLQMGNINDIQTTSTYIPITISNGGTLSSSGTGFDLIGDSQTYTASTGAFSSAGVPTNGYSITTKGETSSIAPGGVFGLTSLNAAAGAQEIWSSTSDLLSVFTLTTSGQSNGDFVINASALAGFTPGTPYDVLQWVSNGTDDLNDFSVIPPSGYTDSMAFGTNGGMDDLTVTFTAVPEPTTAAMMLAPLAALLMRRKRRN